MKFSWESVGTVLDPARRVVWELPIGSVDLGDFFDFLLKKFERRFEQLPI